MSLGYEERVADMLKESTGSKDKMDIVRGVVSFKSRQHRAEEFPLGEGAGEFRLT